MISSSGIKRGVAASAISALAVAGLPFLATAANAAPGDDFTVTYTGPALDGGDEGALVIIRAQDGEITPGLIKAIGTSGTTTGTEDNENQTVEVLSASGPVDDPSNSAFDFIEVRVAVDTTTTGSTASFRLFEDDSPTNNTLNVNEAVQAVSISTAGPLASIDVSPATQSSPENIESGAYTVTLKDAAGRTTQLLEADQLNISQDGTVTINETGPDTDADDDIITSDEIVRGTDTFTATGTTAGSRNILVEDAANPAIEDTAVLNVTESANLTADEINIVTAADTWDGFGGGTEDGVTAVRVDQNTIRFDFDADNSDANSNVQLTVDGNGVTFGGQDKATYTTTLDANGIGSITVTVDAATIQDVDSFLVDINGFGQTINFDRAMATSIDGESATYFCQDDAACTVTAVVLDQFGNPVTTGEVEARRTGPQNVDSAPQRKPVGSDGTVDFTFTDTNVIDGGTDTVQFGYFTDSADSDAGPTGSTAIKYSATGQGSDFVIGLDGQNTELPAYDADDAAVIPLTDTVADEDGTGQFDDGDEDAVITLTGGEPNQAVTLSVDNGALILAPGETMLSQGSASVEATLDNTGALPADYRVIGTNSGLVTLTVDSAGRTETAPLTVSAQDDVASVRNVTLSSPATVPAGTNQIVFTAVFTDAFGNPVSGVPNGVLNKQVTGPGMYQDGDAESDANGVLRLNVRVDSGASGAVTLTVDGNDNVGQFGADADRQFSYSTTDDGKGLAASSDVASSTTTVEGAPVEPPVDTTRQTIVAKLLGRNTGKAVDKLKVVTEPRGVANGARVNLFRFNKNGVRVLVESSELNANGVKRFQVADLNGKRFTKYVAKVKRTADSKADRTNRKRVR